MEDPAKKNYRGWLLLFILVKFLLQYVLSGNGMYELHRDEFLHLDQAKHLAWGYLSVPPFTSWISWIILQLGNSLFWIRFFPALFGALTIVVVWEIVLCLNGKLYALLLTGTALTFSVLLRINLLYQPNSADVFFWTLLLYTILKYIQSGKAKWLYFAALAFGFGFLNKYNIIFCLAGLVPALLIGYRKIFLKKELYLAMLLALAVISPNLFWQYQHHFPVIAHMKELQQTQLVNVSRISFIKEQFLMFIAALLILFTGFIGFFTYDPFKKYRAIFFVYPITIVVFIYLQAKAYYAVGLYPVYFAFGTVYLEYLLQSNWKKYLRIVPFIIILGLFVPFYYIAFPIKTPAQFYQDAAQNKPFSTHTWEDGRKHPISQDFADMLGWKELAKKTDQVMQGLPDRANTMIITNNYGQAGAINYYSLLPGTNAVSFNADYVRWFELDVPVHNLIRVVEMDDSLSSMERKLFRSITEKGKINNKYAREFGTKIYLLKEPVSDINLLLKRKLAEQK